MFRKSKRFPWEPDWAYRVEGMFWRLKYSEEGTILCEVRDPEKKTTWFNALNEQSGEPLWEGLVLDEPWWIGVEDVSRNRAYLHRFRKPDMPQHTGIICIDLLTGNVLWENPNMTFFLVDGLQVYASMQGFESRKYFLLDKDSGQVVREFGLESQEVHSLRAAQNEEYLFRNYSYPEPFDTNHPLFPDHKEQVYSHVPVARVIGNLDILVTAGIMLLSWHETTKNHTPNTPDLAQQFLAVEIVSNSVLYADTINESVQADAIDSFFIKEQRLYYIKERSVLTSFVLPTG